MFSTHPFALIGLSILGGVSLCYGQWSLDVTTPRTKHSTDLGLGQTISRSGHILRADDQCLYLDNTPWLPAAGEFQFSRYPRSDWHEELLKMKAGGIDVIGTYVFWNHIEEERGTFNWSGQRSLHDFLKECQKVGLKALVRMGPWVHGESRNGGFPDWLVTESKAKHFRLRTTDQGYIDCVTPYYKSMAGQMKGLLWKDDGPVIGIQVDNECHDLPYLQKLKSMAIADGVDVPLYTMTGWAVPVPESGLIPMFGRYGDAFWVGEGDPETNKSYLINNIRDDGDMGIIGGQVTNMNADRASQLEKFPHFCIETGGGMQSTYDRRILMKADDTGSLALCRVASGANLLGYYIFHGGITPDGKFSSLNESTASGYPFNVPLKDYDFNAPITNCGVLRPSYHLLRELHLFLQSFGKELAPMPGHYPTDQPKTLEDTSTLRWSVRSDGKSGFLFFNNFQQSSSMPEKHGVQFSLQTSAGVLKIPSHPITIPNDSYGIWPINLNCNGVNIAYATAQPLTFLSDKEDWYFFKAIPGINPEFSVTSNKGLETIDNLKIGTQIAFSRIGRSGRKVNFVVLTSSQSEEFWRVSIKGRDRAVLAKDAVLPEISGGIDLKSVGTTDSGLEIFPSSSGSIGSNKDGIFQIIKPGAPVSRSQPISVKLVKPFAIDPAIKVDAMSEAAWSQAAVWKVPIIYGDKLLRINYAGDVARVYCGGKLIADNFYNGGPFDIGLWRIPRGDRANLELRIMPLAAKARGRLKTSVRAKLPEQPNIAMVENVTALERIQTKFKL